MRESFRKERHEESIHCTSVQRIESVKTTTPAVPIDVWKNLYSAAAKFSSLRPWEKLHGLDLIAVRDSSTGEAGYGAVMGSGGTLFGFCSYRGAEGFDFYRRLINGEIDPEAEELFAMQNCLKLEFGPRSALWAEDHAVIRQLGLSFKGKHAWPEFRSFLPGYAPWFFTEVEARLFTLALDAACHHLEKVKKGETEESLRDNECLVYSVVGGSSAQYNARWEPWPILAPAPIAVPILNLARINAILAKKPKVDSPWEADVFYLPSTIHDRERPYFMRLVVVCQQSSGFVFMAEPSLPEPSVPQLLADAICSSIERHGFLPETIFMKRREEAAALAPLARALGVTTRVKKKLDAVQMLKEDMMERLAYGGGRGRR